MCFKYLDFSVNEMLRFLSRRYSELELSSSGVEWCITVVTDGVGFKSYSGTLNSVIVSAFKPHIEEARMERVNIKNKFMGC